MDEERIAEINAALHQIVSADPAREMKAVDAGNRLDALGVLRDSEHRPGLPLRRLLREGFIEHVRQEGGRWWFIECGVRH